MRQHLSHHILGFSIDHHRTHWHPQGNISAICTVLITATTRLAILGLPTGLEMIIGQIRDIRIRQNIDRTTAPAVAAIWATLGLVFAASKTKAAIATITGLEIDLYLIVKHAPFSSEYQRIATSFN